MCVIVRTCIGLPANFDITATQDFFSQWNYYGHFVCMLAACLFGVAAAARVVLRTTRDPIDVVGEMLHCAYFPETPMLFRAAPFHFIHFC